MVLFTRFIEPGRLCYIQCGPDEGKLCFIVEIITLNRVLIDGAGKTGVARQQIPIKRLLLTDFKVKMSRGVRRCTLKNIVEKDDVISKFYESNLGKKILRKKARLEMTDYERFSVMAIRKQRRAIMKTHLKTKK